MPSPERVSFVSSPPRAEARPGTLGQAMTAALVVPAVLVLWDLSLMRSAVPAWSASWTTVVTFAACAWGVGASVASLLLAIRARAHDALDSVRHSAGWRGALDGVALSVVTVFAWSPAVLEGTARRSAALVLMPVVAGGLGWLVAPRLRRAIAALVLLSIALVLATLSPASDTMLRLTLQSVLLVAATASLGARALPGRSRFVSATVAAVLAIVAASCLDRAPGARAAWSIHSVHARTWTTLIERWADRDNDLATNLFGGHDCDPARGDVFPGASEIRNNGRDDNCAGRDGVTPKPSQHSRAHGAAAGRDIVILSLDSLRSDVTGELKQTRALLGDYASLTRAFSPTPKTVTSISSMVRGRPFRQLEFKTVAGVRSPVPVNGKTLGQVLTEAGYRALTVPTHRYLTEQGRVLAGFESLAPGAHHLAARFVPGTAAIDLVVAELSESKQPACVFLHFMEPHHPYRYGDQSGPDSIVGLRNAARYVDDLMGIMIKRVTEARGRAPVVAVLGDHGEEFDEHGGRFHASTAYTEQVHVGLMLAGPGVPHGSFDAPVSTAAVPATLLDLVGLDPEPSFTEPSLLPFLTGDAPAPTVAVSEVRAGLLITAYSFESFRLLVDSRHSAQLLFDSKADPFERRDLSEQRPELLRELSERAREWDERH